MTPLLVFTAALAASAATPPAGDVALDEEGCVSVALRASGQVAEAHAKIKDYAARLQEVQATFYPKLVATAYAAPMFTVHGDAVTGFERRWKSLGDWGPYGHLEALLALPLYTFGRAEDGARAASERLEVEKAQARVTENAVAFEVRKLYHLRTYALSFNAPLQSAFDIVTKAEEQAKELYAQSTGEVTQADLMKLRYAATEVQKYLRQSEDGATLALAALKHTMGLPLAAELALRDERLRKLPETDLAEKDFDELLARAVETRPELAQLKHGAEAARLLRSSERAANWPVLFVAGQLAADWTPQRDDSPNPYHFDPYNQIFGGVALGLRFDSDPARTAARVAMAEATADQVEALRQYASTGIPLQVRKALLEVEEYRRLTELSDEGVRAAQKWMIFAATAYGTGAGEARDVLEGLVAFLQAKRGYYDNLLAYHIATAELRQATGG